MKRILPSIAFIFMISGVFSQDLDTYLKIAVENNPGLQAQYKAYQAAMEKIPQAASLSDPQLSFGYFAVPVETRVGAQQARLSLTQMFPWFGTLAHQRQATALAAEARFQHFLDAKNKLEFQVKTAYYRLCELEMRTALEQESVQLLQTYKRLSSTQLESGEANLVQLIRVELLLESAKTELKILNRKRKTQTADFNSLLNRTLDAVVKTPKTLSAPSISMGPFKEKVSLENPGIAVLQLEQQAAKSKEKVAVKNGLPKIGVGVDYLFVGTRPVENLTDNGKDAWMPRLSISLPVFRKKYKAAQKSAVYQQKALALQKQALYNELHGTLEKANFKIQEQQEYLRLHERQIQAGEQSLRLLEAAYNASQATFEELLQMQQQLLKYQKAKAKALALLYTAIAEQRYIAYNKIE